MFPGMNSRQAKQMMRKMGMTQEDIEATEVIIKTPEKELIINNPQVAKVNMMGQETFQIVGEVQEKDLPTEPEISEDDIKTVMEQANVTKEEAEKVIKENNGDLAAAIMSLKQ